MSLNRLLIRDRFEDIRQSLERLERIRLLSREAFLTDQDTLPTGRRTMSASTRFSKRIWMI